MAAFIPLVPEASRGRRGIEPDIDALDQMTSHIHIVVVQKYQTTTIANF